MLFRSVWSVFVAASQASRTPVIGGELARFIVAGDTIGGATLSRFFAFHVFFIPALVFAFLAVHLWMVLHHGVSEPPEAGRPVDPKTYREWYHHYLETHGVPFWPDAAWRDVVFGVGMVVVIMLLAIFWGPPHLGSPPDPSLVEAYPRPDWYFLWIFAALALLPAESEDLVMILAPLVIGALLIGLPFFSNKGERHPRRRPWAVGIVIIVLIMVGTLWRTGINAPWSPAFDVEPLPAEAVPAGNELVAQGAQLFYTEGCIYCHAYAEQGGVRGPNLTNVSERLSTEQITIAILAGREDQGMPSYAALSNEEVQALVAFFQAQVEEEEETASQ